MDFGKAIGVILIIIFVEILSALPSLGYSIEIENYTELGRETVGRIIISAKYNAAFNPFLYGLTWVYGKGYIEGYFNFTTTPQWYLVQGPTGDVFLRYRNPTPTEIREQATSNLAMEQFNINALFNIAMLILVGLMRMHDVYLCIMGGILGFAVAGILGAFIFFIAILIIAIYVKLRMWKEGILTKIVRFLLEEEVYPYEF
ncbi:MAG: hypothetical protein QXT26_08680 [Thermoproteota archaeon]